MSSGEHVFGRSVTPLLASTGWILGLVLGLAPVSPAMAARPTKLVFRGNSVLTEDVYRTVLKLSNVTDGRRQKGGYAGRIRRKLLEFLRASGYSLAKVETKVKKSTVEIDIDEGQLDKVIFVRQSTFDAIQRRFELDLPGKIFNQPLLERKLDELADSDDVRDAYYKLVAVNPVEHKGVQLETKGLLPTIAEIDQARTHELHIYVEQERGAGRLHLGAGFHLPDGLFIRGHYPFESLFLEKDRWVIRGLFASRVTRLFEIPKNALGISRAALASSWYTPPFFGDVVQAFVSVRGDLWGRQRPDLDVENYFYAPVFFSLNLELSMTDYLVVSGGFGFERTQLFGLASLPSTSPAVFQAPEDQWRMAARARMRMTLSPREIRKDRGHRLHVEFMQRFRGEKQAPANRQFAFNLRSVILFGWDEFVWELKGLYLTKDTPFFQERSLTDGFVRGVFSSEFSRELGSLGAEYRLSLTRDILKVGLFHDLATYLELERNSRAPEKRRVANSVGLSIHILFLDGFQFSAYAGLGFNTNSDKDAGLRIQLQQVF